MGTNGNKGKILMEETSGRVQAFDEGGPLFPDGMWMPVCRKCAVGPVGKGQQYCGDFNGIAPGQCITEIIG